MQRDLYSAFLLAYLEPEQTLPSVTQPVWEGAEPRLRAVMEELQQRANEGQNLPRSMGVSASGKAARAGARRLESPAYPHQEPVVSSEGDRKRWVSNRNPRAFMPGRSQNSDSPLQPFCQLHDETIDR